MLLFISLATFLLLTLNYISNNLPFLENTEVAVLPAFSPDPLPLAGKFENVLEKHSEFRHDHF